MAIVKYIQTDAVVYNVSFLLHGLSCLSLHILGELLRYTLASGQVSEAQYKVRGKQWNLCKKDMRYSNLVRDCLVVGLESINSTQSTCIEFRWKELAVNTFNLFISHSWTYSDAYDGLINLLDLRAYFYYRNYSVPKDDPLHTNGTDLQLYNAIKNKISPCSVILILAGVYSSYSKWIENEIYIAKNEFLSNKPIVAIEPWGSERTSIRVKEAAAITVGWNTDSIVSAIRALA